MKKYVTKEENTLTKSEKKELHLLLDNLLTWSVHVKKYLYWSSRPKWRVMLFDDKELIGSLSVVKRKIKYKENSLYIGGIGNVGIKKGFQGKGYAQKMLRFAQDKLRKENCSCALLFCDEKRTNLYEKVGYQRILKPITYYSKSTLKKEPIAMILPINLSQEDLKDIRINRVHIGRGTW